MRISADPLNPDYKIEARSATVYLDGAKRNDIITADEERGYVICLAKDESGRIIVSRETDEAEVVMLTGSVRVELA